MSKMDQNLPLITDVEGVYANGISIGIKQPAKKDLALIYVPDAFSSAGVFTTNRFAAPSVSHTRKILKSNTLKALLINSGNANTGIGKDGSENTKELVARTAKHLNLRSSEVGMGSTGIIGVPLTMDTMRNGVDTLLNDPLIKDGHAAAEAILTTDTFVKEFGSKTIIDGKEIIVAGITKGSGMIEPNMATTLTYLVTNAAIPTKELNTYLKEAVDQSYNLISVDSDMSTSDMVVIISTGEHKLKLFDLEQRHAFKDALTDTCKELAKLVVKDGEGATKVIEVTVEGATSFSEARLIAKSVVNSPLVKTAVYGEDPNWGRVLMAAGKVPSKLNPDKCEVRFGSEIVFSKGIACTFDEKVVKKDLSHSEVKINVNLNLGKHSATVLGCDLTEGYIKINTDYN